MLFNSAAFICFYLPIVFASTFAIGRISAKLAALWLGLASLVFYGMWDLRFVPLLLLSMAGNFLAGSLVVHTASAERRALSRAILVVAIVLNLALLGTFKYANFFIRTYDAATGSSLATLDIVLPLGISFFTFTQIAFLVDCYRGEAKELDPVRYLLFVTYFPHLIAGPLFHHKQMMPQFADPRTFLINWHNVAIGLTIFAFGLAKKVLIADNLAPIATPIFDATRDGTPIMMAEAWIGALSYALQLYFDFSGYCDMAIGLSLMFNIRLPQNFASPYKSTSMIDFWRRWHMTLSAFLRDYLYFPLGGNRLGTLRRYVNLGVVMVLGGLWHGAGWTFIAWGALHGFYLIVNHGWRALRNRLGMRHTSGWIGTLSAGALTFLAVVVGWVLFRSETMDGATNMLRAMAGLSGISLPRPLAGVLGPYVAQWPSLGIVFNGLASVTVNGIAPTVVLIGFSLAIVWLAPNVQQIFAAYQPTYEQSTHGSERSSVHLLPTRWTWEFRPSYGLAAGLLLFASLAILAAQRTSEFIYFQF